MEIRIEDLLTVKKFGPLEMGVSKNVAIFELGKPDCDNDMGEAGSIVLYGWYELFFDHDDLLYAVQNDHYQPSDRNTYHFKNYKFKIDPWFMDGTPNQGIAEISNILNTKGIKYEVVEYYGRNLINLKSGAVIDFDEENNDFGVKELIGIRYFAY